MHIFTDRKHIIIDTRSEKEFIDHHVENSVFVGFHGVGFKYWLELLLPDKNIDIEVITDSSCQQVIDTIKSLGYENVSVLTDITESTSLATIIQSLPNSDTKVLDVRQSDLSQTDAEYLPVSEIIQGKLQHSESPYIVHCDKSYRSLIAVSLLKLLGLCKLIYVDKDELEKQQKLK
ncbi:rhodanese-like domain-containing protein [Photobacterium kishitanii]|uniref:Rhodanese domain-containing protein n=1 Tax=Photobacterium kishitanii TaxID=318456 RepID=A0A0B7JHJ3_9GAMM|nr:rhodanese-like domain-containing protein [Photobacterium kishitanii]PSU91847.1 rhodanese domain-containing protein [Photobacterium kishitanii]PSU92863.1 rhodanese domain-containing protein [Photobacterium kishitanii]PSU93078.1 rhodanese domain-containing protein [Photobacterium kishitanii]PSV13145.1 rhodanese domain-containing protein [Photobacterium kishitanii]CEO41399.1 Metallo-beta-lactamase family protein [Photobacterium kishitanii]